MTIKESVIGEDNQIKNSQADSYRNNRNSLVASKLVLGFPLFKGELSVGGEYSSLNRRMLYTIVPEVTSNENEKVKESMTSAFVDYTRSFGALSVQAGLRYEYNDFDYYTNEIRIDLQSRHTATGFRRLPSRYP